MALRGNSPPCWDGHAGASGKLDPITSQEYGSQDFFGVIDELRIWRTVRSEEQIQQVALILPTRDTFQVHKIQPSAVKVSEASASCRVPGNG